MVGEVEDLVREMAEGIWGVLNIAGLVTVLKEDGGVYRALPPFLGVEGGGVDELSCDPVEVQEFYLESRRRAVHINKDHPLFGRVAGMFGDDDYKLLFWLRQRDELIGCLFVSKKAEEGDFNEEDIRLLSIMGNNFAVALENLELYRSLQLQMKKLKEAQDQLVQSTKLAAIGELAANVAHEINNPLTTILGYAELLKEEEDTEGIKRDLEIIESESLRAREIVQQLLEFSRKRKLEIVEADLKKIIEEVLMLVSPSIKASKIKVDKELNDIPGVLMDANQIKQVLLNLINNAVQAMPDGGRLGIKAEVVGDEIMVSVSDTGMGIPSDVLQRIFEPFFTTKKDKGTGLGLPISYRIVQEHGGRIEVKSTPGKGSVFRVVLPLKRAETAKPA
ncbi:MAG: hypothetical protein D6726_03025 [Nitrospirae bacterium]|nr:MAG: hypothetical protein D6726_03025 [Nitrospirota bacterium]